METDAYVFHEKILELQSERIKQNGSVDMFVDGSQQTCPMS